MKEKTIEEIVTNGLCVGCGTCVAICPTQAITLRKSLITSILEPEIQKQHCIPCGLCISVCPGKGLDFSKFKQTAFKKDKRQGKDNLLLGHFLSCYVGHASNKSIRHHSSSGGLVTALLSLALEENIIDGALVTRMSSANPLEPDSFIAKSSSEILSASRSKYCPVAANVALREILEQGGRYAIVGLPCHLHGIRKAETINIELKNRIVLHFGLFCSHNVNFKGTQFLLRKLSIKDESKIASIAYRARGWPGGFVVQLREGKEKFISHNSYWASLFGRFFFAPWRCTLCPDGLAELADISFGDAWLSEFRREKDGESILLVRNEEGKKLINLAIRTKKVELTRVEGKKVLQSQRDQILFKKKNLPARIALVHLFGNCVPHFEGIRFLKPNLWDRITSFIPYINIKISDSRLGRIILFNIPAIFLRTYGIFIQKLYNRTYEEHRSVQTEPVAPSSQKFVIINSYSPNIGDLSIIISMVSTLRQTFPKAEFTVFATDRTLTAKYLGEANIYRSLGSRSSRWWRQASNFLIFLRNWLWLRFRQKEINLFFLARRRIRHALYEYLDADIILSCGGGYLNDNSGSAFLGCLFDIYLGTLLRKPVMLYAQSIGPIRNKMFKRIAKKVLNTVDLITLRDEVSVKFLDELGIKSPKTVVTADVALLLPQAKATRATEILAAAGIDEKLPLVTITIKPWHFPGSANPTQQKQKYVMALSKLCELITGKYNVNVLFVPMDVRSSCQSEENFVAKLKRITKGHVKKILRFVGDPVFIGEIDLIKKLLYHLSNQERVTMLQGEYTPSEIKAIIGRSTIHIATRMHSSIYATSLSVPTLAIAYEPKMVSFMARLRQDRFVVNIEAVEPERLMTMFDDLWIKKTQVNRTIQQEMGELKELFSMNNELIRELFSE